MSEATVFGLSGMKQLERHGQWVYCHDCQGMKTRNWFTKPDSGRCDSCTEDRRLALRRKLERYDVIAKRCANYNLTVEEFQMLERHQNYCCAICGRRQRADRPLHIDHDHATGEVRGLLCIGCNTGLGKFADSQDRLRVAIAYLESPPSRNLDIGS